MTIRSQITLPENIKLSNYEKESDLLLAIRFSKLASNFEIAKTLLESYGFINKIDKNGKTLLINVLTLEDEHINMDIIKLIIDKGAHTSKTPNLFIKIITELENLLDAEAIDNFKEKMKVSNCVPLTLAIRKKNIEIVKYLLDKGANIDEQDNFFDTMLITATEYDNFEIFKMAIERKANLDLLDIRGNPALYYALKQTNIEYVRILLSEGANINKISEKKLFALVTDKIDNKNFDVCSLIINNGLEVYKKIDNVSIFDYVFIETRNDDLLPIIKLILEKAESCDKVFAFKTIDTSNKEIIKILSYSINEKSLQTINSIIIKQRIDKENDIVGKPNIAATSVNQEIVQNTDSNDQKLQEILKKNDELLRNSIKSKNINMIKLILQEGVTDNMFIEIIRLNDMDLLKLCCDNTKLELSRYDILNKLVDDNINSDILDFIYKNLK